MNRFRSVVGSIRFKVPLAMIVVTAALVVAFLRIYEQRSEQLVHESEVEAARSLLLMTESVRDHVEASWRDGTYSAETMRSVMRDSTLDREERIRRALLTVPIVNAWHVAQRTSEAGRFDFRPVRRGARNPDNEPTDGASEALDAFDADPSLDEWWTFDERERAVRYYRPVRLSESCLVCHGDPQTAEALWGNDDGRDLLDFAMDGKTVGDLHGAFEVVRSVEAAEAALAAELDRAHQVGLGVVAVAALLVFLLLEFLVGRPLARRVAGMRHAEKSQDLSYRLPPRSPSTEIARMSKAFNGFLEPFHQGISQVARAVSGVVEDSTRVARISADTHRAADDQNAQTQQLAGAMEEFSITAEEMAKTAALTRGHTESAEKAADEGRTVVSDVSQAIEALASEVQVSTDVVMALNDQAQKIGSVVDVIREIADQTGLLSLNAAIEAARAGESGRGFAVVADEVRALAQRTQESTNEIQTIVEQVQQSTTRAAEAMRGSHGMATESVEKSRAATVALDTIANSNREIADAAAQIATAAEQQHGVTKEMAQAITAITEGARGMSGGATETRESTVRIVGALSELEEMVQHFNLGTNDFEFDRARTAHRAWMTRLRSFLDGDSTLKEEEVVSPHECALGRWYYGEGLELHGELESMRALETPHTRLHALVGEIRAHEMRGDRDAAEAKLVEVGEASDQILALLDEVEREVHGERKGVDLF